MSQTLTPKEAAQISVAIRNAEAGSANLVELSRAHHIAERVGATKSLGILRGHIRRHIPAPIVRIAFKDIFIGIVTGIVTWVLLGKGGRS